MQELERWVGNSLATLLAASSIVLGVIGLLLAFGYINDENSVNHFNDGLVWLTLALILGLTANIFRREHPIVDDRDLMTRRTDDPSSRVGSRAR